MVLNLEGENLIDVFGSHDLDGRRDVTLSWANTKVDTKKWVFEMKSRLGYAKDDCLVSFPKQLSVAWKHAKEFSAGEATDERKKQLVLLWACRDKFDPTKQILAEDESAPFERHAFILIDIDLESRNQALTLKERIREALPPDCRYPLALSPSGMGIKLMIPAAVGPGVPWTPKARALFCQSTLESLLGSLASQIKIDTKAMATCRAYLSEEILHELVGETREVTPVVLEASSFMESVFGEKKTAGEFPDITKWSLASLSNETFQALVQAQIAAFGCGRRLNRGDDIPSLSRALGSFLKDNNPLILNAGEPELLFNDDQLDALTEVQRAAIAKNGAALFLKQLRGQVSVLRFIVSSRKWGVDAPRSVRFVSHGLAQCGIDIHSSQVDNLLKKLVLVGLLERTKVAQRGRTPSWYKLLGPAEQDFTATMANQLVVFDAPKDGEWNKAMIGRVWAFDSSTAWLEHVLSLQGIHAKADRLPKCIEIWNWKAKKKHLELIDFSSIPS